MSIENVKTDENNTEEHPIGVRGELFLLDNSPHFLL